MTTARLPLGLAVLLALALTAWPEAARATGERVDLDRYCNAAYDPGGEGPGWKAVYLSQRQQWQCQQATIVGPQFIGGGIRAIVPAEVCLREHGTRMVHFHRGDDPALQSSIHCGIYDGAMPAERDMVTTRLEICNDRARSIRFAVAWHEWWPRERYSAGYVSRGWWGLESGACQEFDLPSHADRTSHRLPVFVLGIGWDGVLQIGDAQICAGESVSFEAPVANMLCLSGDWFPAAEFAIRPGEVNIFRFTDRMG